ncbi:MAG: hypothetical protein F4Z58_11445 [Acidimicrobiaceae bacterium]|nr:hypothetical protein [Acidimicrobiaceae bacterium]
MALPGERWCEVTHRRDRCANLRELLTDSEREWSIDDAITENLDLRELLADYLAALSTADECDTAFNVLRNLTVCDPTVGSGAFLFAALEVLDPLYEGVLDRAAEIHDRTGVQAKCLQNARVHHSDRYWMLKTICLHNLFGVDLMAEAPEIAKLRLFLKLAAQIDDVSLLEPLPDLDFNIKTGNLLVGIADKEDAEARLGGGQLDLGGEIEEIAAVSDRVGDAYERFTAIQSRDSDQRDLTSAKQTLIAKLETSRKSADELLYGKREESQTFEEWRSSHSPFHWFVEFPSVWRNDGFDVVIGNPPYIKKSLVTDYTWTGYVTEKCPDLYALCVERASNLVNDKGWMSMIVMHSLCFSGGFSSLRRFLDDAFGSIWVSSFAKRPSLLFAGSADVRNSIVVAKSQPVDAQLFSTGCKRWLSETRDRLFDGLQYALVPDVLSRNQEWGQWPFLDREFSRAVESLVTTNKPLRDSLSDGAMESPLYFKTVAQYFLSVFVDPPPSLNPLTGEPAVTKSKRVGCLHFANDRARDLALLILGGRWGYLWWMMYGDEFNVTRSSLVAFPGDIERLSNPAPGDMELASLLALSRVLQDEMPSHLAWQVNAGVKVGRYNMFKLRHITDEADLILAKLWGIENAYEAAGNLRDRMVFGNKE